MRGRALVPIALLAAGAALVAGALLEGGASLALVIVVPVLYGRSLAFVVGAVLIAVGCVTLPLALGPFEPAEDEADATSPAARGDGGLVLIGPVPIFFGRWSGVPERARVIVAVVGLVLFAVAVALVLRAV